MAIERVVRCDICGEYVAKEDRRRVAVRRDEDRPESAEYMDICVPHRQATVDDVIKWTDEHRAKVENGED